MVPRHIRDFYRPYLSYEGWCEHAKYRGASLIVGASDELLRAAYEAWKR